VVWSYCDRTGGGATRATGAGHSEERTEGRVQEDRDTAIGGTEETASSTVGWNIWWLLNPRLVNEALWCVVVVVDRVC